MMNKVDLGGSVGERTQMIGPVSRARGAPIHGVELASNVGLARCPDIARMCACGQRQSGNYGSVAGYRCRRSNEMHVDRSNVVRQVGCENEAANKSTPLTPLASAADLMPEGFQRFGEA